MSEPYKPLGAETAETILQSAAEVFAEKGFDGARVDELARAAGVNKATLYYQIGDKEALYHAVLTRVLQRAADELCATLDTLDEGEKKIRAFVDIFARHTDSMRYAAPIMLREIASGGRNLPDAALDQMGRVLGALDSTLNEGQRKGDFRPVNTFMVHMMIVGGLMLYSANEPIRQRNVERKPDIHDPSHFITHEQAGREIGDLVLAAIRNNKP